MSNAQITTKMWPLTNQMWMLRSSVKKLAWCSDSSKSSVHSLPWTTSSHLKIRLWRSESECSRRPPGKHKLVNMRWLSPLCPGHAQGGGFKWLVHNKTITQCDRILLVRLTIPSWHFLWIWSPNKIVLWGQEKIYMYNNNKQTYSIHIMATSLERN